MRSSHFSQYSLYPQIVALLLLTFLNTSLYSQSDTIVKISDNGIYITSQGDTIVPYSIVVPSNKESEKYGVDILTEIHKWVNDYLLGQVFTVTIIDTLSSHSFSAKIFRERFNGQQDYAELLVDMGFAQVDSSLENTYSNSLKKTQFQSIKNQKGIWQIFKPSVLVPNPPSKEYLDYDSGFGIKYAALATFAISTVLTWDYATQVADLSTAIDDAKQIEDYDAGPLERERTRKIIYTAVCGITAVVSLYIAIDSFELRATNNRLNFLYRF